MSSSNSATDATIVIAMNLKSGTSQHVFHETLSYFLVHGSSSSEWGERQMPPSVEKAKVRQMQNSRGCILFERPQEILSLERMPVP